MERRKQNMIVRLISYSPNPDVICSIAGNLCHSKRSPTEIINDKNHKDTLSKIINMGHLSILEHVIFTFSIEDVSRVLTHQLVRHRIASFSQQSQRYVSIDEPKFITPNTIRNNNSAMDIYKNIMLSIWDAYKNLKSIGIPIEDARYVLPNGCATNIIITMNARELLHFFSLRCCNRSQ